VEVGRWIQGTEPGWQADQSARPPSPQTIAVIIPTALKKAADGRPLLAACLESLLPPVELPEGRLRNGAPPIAEVVIVTQGRPFEGSVLGRLSAAGVLVRQLDVVGAFNFSRKINAGAALATADVLFLLNDDAAMREASWPSVFLEILGDPTVGAVGPVIFNPDGTLNAAGDSFSGEGARHIDAFDVQFRPGLRERLTHDHDVSLLTAAAMAIRASDLRSIGGFDEAYPSSLGDTDLCFRLRSRNLRLVCTPRIQVVHAESSTRDPKVPAGVDALAKQRHPALNGHDPLLPPLILPKHVRVLRIALRPVRGLYRRTFKKVVPPRAHYRLWRVAVSRGWVR
jgi:hypothetical protein